MKNEEISIKKEESAQNNYHGNDTEFFRCLLLNNQINIKREETHTNPINLFTKDEGKNYFFDSYNNNAGNQLNLIKCEYFENLNDPKLINSIKNEYFDNFENIKNFNLQSESIKSIQTFQTLSTTDITKKSFEIKTSNFNKNEKNFAKEKTINRFLANDEITKETPSQNCSTNNQIDYSDTDKHSKLLNNIINANKAWLYHQMIYYQYLAEKEKSNKTKEEFKE